MPIQPAIFETHEIRRVYDEETETWWLSVVDIIQVLTRQPDYQTARKYCNKLKERLSKEGSQLVTACHQLKMLAADGKQRPTDAATAETLLRLVQSVPSPKAEPIKLWLAKVGYERVDNLNSPLDGVLNTRADVTNLERLRQKSVANLAAPDQLEATPIFARGTATSGGFSFNRVLTRNLAGYFGYANTHSENTGTVNQGTDIPYLPKHRATLGMTWAGDQRTIVSAQTVWRSTRFADEANLTPLASGWGMTLKLHWESEDKRWNLEGYAANLLNRDVEDLLGVSLIVRF